ncbi:MAG TPA: LysE family transporter [Methanospirillum sp.]|uniref:LysE family transporter n=1 Tax=Methanospirillum sp. TaxID=45200 RepID=UPI002C4F6716|nr:LysE family transporter [Methanospirillum sp.]HOJ97040.1 LysE family transporter [Methanospirillum sp.]HOL41462.1 LysE family transporter [Methanospirillum sp.]HPP76615.1 LysE family transporter [Methanospirillum sp.]
MSIPDLVFLGFIIGLTGALAPGPTLIATIRSSLHNGWTGGPRVTFGHIIAEMGIVVLIAAGISSLPDTLRPVLSGVGGIALIIFGAMTLCGSREAVILTDSDSGHASGPVIAGLVTSVSNPYFWIWWFSVGSALLISSLNQGIIGIIAFITGHWASDLAWFTLVSVSIHRSRTMLSTRTYRGILILCGIFLVIFGLWYLVLVVSI